MHFSPVLFMPAIMALNILKLFIPAFLLFFCSCVSPFADYEYAKFNETCTHSDNCVDYKMVCARVENDEMRCLCSDILYTWSDQLEECIMDSKKLKSWLFRVKSDSNDLALNKNEFDSAFVVLTLCSVIIVIALLAFLACLCVIHGCRFKHVQK